MYTVGASCFLFVFCSCAQRGFCCYFRSYLELLSILNLRRSYDYQAWSVWG